MAPHQWFVALATLLLLFAACGGDEEQPPAALADADALAFVYATKPTTPVLLVYKSGEALTILGENGNGAASGAVFAAPRLDPLIVEAGERGLPTRAYVSGYTFVFRNWRQTAVDVGVVDASGATQALPDVQWPDDVVSPTLSLGSASVALAIRDAYDLIGAAACVIREATASLDHNVTFPTVGAACTRLATKITVALLQEDGDSSRWQEALDLTDASLVAAGCVVPSSSTAINCADFVLAAATEAGSEARRAAEAAEEPLRQLADELRPAVTGARKGTELIATLHAHVPFVRTVAFAPDGATLAGGGDDKVKLWDVATQQEIATLDVLGSWGYLAFSPDGATLAVDVRGYVELWDINAREQIGRTGGGIPPLVRSRSRPMGQG